MKFCCNRFLCLGKFFDFCLGELTDSGTNLSRLAEEGEGDIGHYSLLITHYVFTYRRCRRRRGCRTRWRWRGANVSWTGYAGAGRRRETAPRRQPKKTQYPVPSLFLGQNRRGLCQIPAKETPRKRGKMGENSGFADTFFSGKVVALVNSLHSLRPCCIQALKASRYSQMEAIKYNS